MRPRRLLLLFIIALLAGALCAGCWNRREPELLGMVLAVGFDYDEERDLYRVIAQLANPVAMGQSSGGESGGGNSGAKKPFWTLKASGHTPFEATRILLEYSSRELFWAHCRVVLFSEKLARRGLEDVLDLLERNRQLRLVAKPVVVDGDIFKMIESDFPLEQTGARGMDRFIVTTDFERSIFPEKDLNEVISTLSQKGNEMFIGRMKMLDQEKESEAGGTDSAPPVQIGGGALFRSHRMVGWATNEQTQGWNYITGRAFRSELVIEAPEQQGNFVSIGTFGHSAKMRLIGDESNWKIELRVKVHGRIQDFAGPGKLDAESRLTRSLERRAAEAVRNDIEAAISRAQELKSDIFGFGNFIYRKNPALWQKIAPRWEEKILPQLKIDLIVEFVILRSGLTYSPS